MGCVIDAVIVGHLWCSPPVDIGATTWWEASIPIRGRHTPLRAAFRSQLVAATPDGRRRLNREPGFGEVSELPGPERDLSSCPPAKTPNELWTSEKAGGPMARDTAGGPLVEQPATGFGPRTSTNVHFRPVPIVHPR